MDMLFRYAFSVVLFCLCSWVSSFKNPDDFHNISFPLIHRKNQKVNETVNFSIAKLFILTMETEKSKWKSSKHGLCFCSSGWNRKALSYLELASLKIFNKTNEKRLLSKARYVTWRHKGSFSLFGKNSATGSTLEHLDLHW